MKLITIINFKFNAHFSLVDELSSVADLSKNRFWELPTEVTKFWSLERLQCYHNAIRSVPESIVFLQSLVYLDLRLPVYNQLIWSVIILLSRCKQYWGNILQWCWRNFRYLLIMLKNIQAWVIYQYLSQIEIL